jgi:hypothetical protein
MNIPAGKSPQRMSLHNFLRRPQQLRRPYTRSTVINQIQIGDHVANADPGAPPVLPTQTHTVTAIHVTHDDIAYTDVTINTTRGPATITGTAHRLYWDATTRTWTPANQLHLGDHLQTTHGTQDS